MPGFHARRIGAAIITTILIATACGGGGEDASEDVVLRTQGDISVEEDAVAETTTTASAGADAGDDGSTEDVEPSSDEATTTTTLPQEEESAGDALFTAVGEFQSCLAADGYEFIGIPDASLGDVPQNAQPYIDSLIACAARSQIQERLAEAGEAQADLTPEEVEDQNRVYLEFRDCMIGRGWNIPEPVPDEFGLLFPGFAAAAQWTGPPGEAITSSDDVGECTDQAGIDFDSDS